MEGGGVGGDGADADALGTLAGSGGEEGHVVDVEAIVGARARDAEGDVEAAAGVGVEGNLVVGPVGGGGHGDGLQGGEGGGVGGVFHDADGDGLRGGALGEEGDHQAAEVVDGGHDGVFTLCGGIGVEVEGAAGGAVGVGGGGDEGVVLVGSAAEVEFGPAVGHGVGGHLVEVHLIGEVGGGEGHALGAEGGADGVGDLAAAGGGDVDAVDGVGGEGVDGGGGAAEDVGGYLGGVVNI